MTALTSPVFGQAWGRATLEEVTAAIESGADVNAKIQAGKFKDQTPLDMAIGIL